MNPLLRAALASLVRHLLAGAAGYLVARGVWTQEEAAAYTAAFALFLVGFGWAVWQKFRVHELILRALALPSGSDIRNLRR